MLTGARLFGGNEADVMRKNKKGDVDWCKRFRFLSTEAQDFVRRLLEVDPADRLSAREALAHMWLRGVQPPRAHAEEEDASQSFFTARSRAVSKQQPGCWSWGSPPRKPTTTAKSGVVAATIMAKEIATEAVAATTASWGGESKK